MEIGLLGFGVNIEKKWDVGYYIRGGEGKRLRGVGRCLFGDLSGSLVSPRPLKSRIFDLVCLFSWIWRSTSSMLPAIGVGLFWVPKGAVNLCLVKYRKMKQPSLRRLTLGIDVGIRAFGQTSDINNIFCNKSLKVF